MFGYPRAFRLLFMFVVPTVFIYFLWLRGSMLGGFWRSAWSEEYSHQVWREELYLRIQVRKDLTQPFNALDSLFGKMATEESPERFRKWISSEASTHPLIRSAAIWDRSTGLIEEIHLKHPLQSEILPKLRTYLEAYYSPLHYDDKTGALADSLLLTAGGFSTYGDFAYNDWRKPAKDESYQPCKFAFAVFWDEEYYRSALLPSLVKQIGRRNPYGGSDENYTYRMPVYWTSSEVGGHSGVLLEDPKGDTLFAVGMVNRADTSIGLRQTGSRFGFDRRLPGWNLIAQNREPLKSKTKGLIADLGNTNRMVIPGKWEEVSADKAARRKLLARWFKLTDPQAFQLLFSCLFAYTFVELWGLIRERDRQRNFIAHISHELRTPATKMKLFAETLREDRAVSPEKEAEYLSVMVRAADEVAAITDNVLNLSRFDAGGFKADLREGDIIAFLNSLQIAYEKSLKIEGFTLKYECPASLPQVRFDTNLLSLAIRNLIENALKYSGELKEIELTCRLTDAKSVEISVSDRGRGVPARLRKKIFDRFYRIQSPDSPPVGGAGVGLAVVKEIVRRHKGKVWCESRDGGGSKFTLRLPAA